MANESGAGGYGKPPKTHQFKPGQSGNPRGRPRKKDGLGSAVQRAMSERVPVTENGVRSRRKKVDVTITQLVNQGVKGDRHAAKMLFDMMRSVEAEQQGHAAAPLTAAEQEIFVNLVARIRASAEDDR